MADKVEATIAQLTSKNAAEQADAAQALALLGSDARPAAVALVRVCDSGDDSVREWATSALEGLGPPATEQIPELIALAGNKSLNVAYWVVTLLGRLGEGGAAAVPALTEALLSSTEQAVRERAAWALGQIGAAAKSAIPALQDAAASKQPRLSRLATEALQSIGG